jgi:hypothetical protein
MVGQTIPGLSLAPRQQDSYPKLDNSTVWIAEAEPGLSRPRTSPSPLVMTPAVIPCRRPDKDIIVYATDLDNEVQRESGAAQSAAFGG